MITKMEADKLVEKWDTFYRKDLIINGCDVYIYNYLLSDKEAFADDKGVELRGLTIVKENARERVFPSMSKFFNINEMDKTLESVLRTKVIKKVQNKMDGSLIQFIEINGEILAKSKQSFTNEQAKMAQNILDESTELKFFVLDCWANDFYPLFELVGPSNKIVLDYPNDNLVLIAVRDHNGEYIDVDKFNYKYTTKSYDLSLDEIIHSAKNDKGIEGYVVKFTDGNIVKIKTLDYLDKHRLTDESDSCKIILRRVLEEDMDDIYAIISQNKKEKIQKWEHSIIEYVTHYTQQIFDITKKVKGWERKHIAENYNQYIYFNVLMKCLSGDINDIKSELIDVILKKYNREKVACDFIAKISQ
jgi:T4 RnlA family RNA ligase